jgi:hypothetical protein
MAFSVMSFSWRWRRWPVLAACIGISKRQPGISASLAMAHLASVMASAGKPGSQLAAQHKPAISRNIIING